jgi:hypothetical protein
MATTPTTEPRGERYPGVSDCQKFLDHLADSISEFARCSDEVRERFISLVSRFESACAPLLARAKAEAAESRGGEPEHLRAGNTVSTKDQQKRIVRIRPTINPGGHGDTGPRVQLSQAANRPRDEGDLLFSLMRAGKRHWAKAARSV